MIEIIYNEIPDERALIRLFIDNGLEYAEEQEVATDLVKCWKAEDAKTGNIVGGCVLALRQGRFICDGIATDPSVRGLHVGEHMLNTMICEAKRLGADSLYLVARAPEFFARYGFIAVAREDAPIFFECFSCPQYGTTCQPEVMGLHF